MGIKINEFGVNMSILSCFRDYKNGMDFFKNLWIEVEFEQMFNIKFFFFIFKAM